MGLFKRSSNAFKVLGVRFVKSSSLSKNEVRVSGSGQGSGVAWLGGWDLECAKTELAILDTRLISRIIYPVQLRNILLNYGEGVSGWVSLLQEYGLRLRSTLLYICSSYALSTTPPHVDGEYVQWDAKPRSVYMISEVCTTEHLKPTTTTRHVGGPCEARVSVHGVLPGVVYLFTHSAFASISQLR